MELLLDFESEGFINVDVEKKKDSVTLNTNARNKEDFKRWLEILCNKNKQCFNVYKSYPVYERKVFNQKYICLHGIKHKGVRKTSTGCRVFIHVIIKMVHKRSPEHIRQYPCFVEIQGHHNHSLELTEGLNQLRVSTTTKEIFVKYFEQGMTPMQAHRHHILKMDLCNDIYGQAGHTSNPCRRSIQHMWDTWRKREHGGLNTTSMFEAIEKYAQANPDIIVKMEHSGNNFCIVLITPFMMRAHKELKEAAEVVFVDATGCVDQLNTAVIPFLCAGPAGAVPLALVFTSSQSEATLTKGFGMVKEALGKCAFYGRGKPQCFITDNCEAERKALATTWPTTMLFLCIFHILQQVWRWLLDSKHGIYKEHRKELMHMMKSLVYATSRDEFSALWNEVETSPLLDKYSNFRSYLTTLIQRKEEWAIAFRAGVMLRGHHTNNFAESTICIIKDVVLNRCKAYNTAQLLVFMVEIFDSYMRQRLVDVALSRRRVKSISAEKTADYAIKVISKGMYLVQSQSDQTQVYEVDLTISMCTCVKGQNGAICKHQLACADYGMTAVPQIFVSTSSSRQWLAALAVGREHVPNMSFFKGLTEVTENETDICTKLDEDMEINVTQSENVNTESFPEDTVVEVNERQFETVNTESHPEDDCDLTTDSTVLAEALTKKIFEYGNAETKLALQRLIQQINFVRTTNQLNSLLNSAGSSVAVKHGGGGRGKIPCQPTSIARRSIGMPRGAAPIGKGRRPAGALSSKPKRPRSLAYNIECNVANAKFHGSGH